MVIAAGTSGRPGLTGTLGASRQVITIKLEETGSRNPNFTGGSSGHKWFGAMLGEEVTNERGW